MGFPLDVAFKFADVGSAVFCDCVCAIMLLPDEKVVGLLNGNEKDKPQLKLDSCRNWCRPAYDDQETKKINYHAIHDFAFRKESYKVEKDGSKFSLTLKEEYKKHPFILYALLEDVLGKKCGITQKLSS